MIAVAAGLLGASRSDAFSLLGPYAPWMTTNLSYRMPNDIGGPMAAGEGYRWNLPVVTYGFDQSFINYFGPEGIKAVEDAISIINRLPKASQLSLKKYELDTQRFNPEAQAAHIYDLKSVTLTLLLEQLGLTSPTRNIWIVRTNDPSFCNPFFLNEMTMPPEVVARCLPLRNYDPKTWNPSHYINEALYTFQLYVIGRDCLSARKQIFPENVDVAAGQNSVADGNDPLDLFGEEYISDRTFGTFYTGLSRDDAGGLAYLFSNKNIRTETLDDSAQLWNGSKFPYRTARRLGIEKITFVRQSADKSGRFRAMANYFVDWPIVNGKVTPQLMRRLTTQPDFLFSAKDCEFSFYQTPFWSYFIFPKFWERSDTSHWINNSALNGHPGGDGPGVIRGQAKITFATPGKLVSAAGGDTTLLWNWGRITSSNRFSVFPGNQTNTSSMTLATRSVNFNGTPVLEWDLLARPGSYFQLETSTNLMSWKVERLLQNSSTLPFFRFPLDEGHKFFRLTPVELP